MKAPTSGRRLEIGDAQDGRTGLDNLIVEPCPPSVQAPGSGVRKSEPQLHSLTHDYDGGPLTV